FPLSFLTLCHPQWRFQPQRGICFRLTRDCGLAVRTPHLVAKKQSSAMAARQAEKPCLRYPGGMFLCCGRGAARALAAAIAVSSLITLAETCFPSAGVSRLIACLVQSHELARHGVEIVATAVLR